MQYKIILKTLKEKRSKIREEELSKENKQKSNEKSTANNLLFNMNNTGISSFSNQTKDNFHK
jgi:hypothetical protein